MKHRRTLMSGLAAVAISAAGLIGAAAPAQAAVNHDIVWDCTSNDVIVDAQVGDTITFQPSACTTIISAAYGYNPLQPSIPGFTSDLGGSGFGWVFDLSTGAQPSANLVEIVGSNGLATLTSGDAMAWLAAVGSPLTVARVIFVGASTPEAGPAPVHQGLPLPASGSCSDIQDVNYAWGTGLTGGWTKAWEPWVNLAAGKGGWACTRTLVSSGSTWVLQA